MRKVFTHLKFFLTVTALLMAVSSPLYADMEFTVDDIRYESYDGTTAVVISNPDVKYSGDIVIPQSVEYNTNTYSITSIGSSAFSDCSGLTSIEIPNSITSIGGYAFYGCTSLTSIEISNSVTSIGSSAFSGCRGLTSIVVKGGNSVYDSREACNAIIKTESNELIAGCQTTKIPNSITSIGSSAFSGCTGLTSIKIPNSVTSIGISAFLGCSGLTSIEIPSSVTSIGEYAFYDCSSLTLIEIPNGVISIGKWAFNHCSGITAVFIPSSVAVIGMWAFSYDTSLVSIKVDSNNPIYDSRNDCNAIIETKTNTLVVGCKTTYIPYSVTAIGGGAFCGLAGLTSIEIPCNVVSIGGKYDPSYGLYAIENCKDLASIICNSKKPPITEYDFLGIDKNIPVYVLCESLEEYKNAYGWKDFKNFRCIEADSTEDEIDEPMVEPDSKSVEIIWPVEEGADKYVITITLGGNPFCTLTFDSKGLLLNIDFAVAEPTTKSALATNAEITIYGYKFNITGLTNGTEYGYTVSALDVNDNVLKEFEGSFRTSDPVTVEDNQADSSHSISDSVLVNGKTISVSGIDDSDIRIYNTAGKQVGNPVPTAGVYVVAVGDEVVKVVVP